MNGNKSWIYYTKINILTWKIICKPLKVFLFFVKTAVKFRNLQINKILNPNKNPFQDFLHIFETYTV